MKFGHRSDLDAATRHPGRHQPQAAREQPIPDKEIEHTRPIPECFNSGGLSSADREHKRRESQVLNLACFVAIFLLKPWVPVADGLPEPSTT